MDRARLCWRREGCESGSESAVMDRARLCWRREGCE